MKLVVHSNPSKVQFNMLANGHDVRDISYSVSIV